jgi:serine/threonine protein kinase/Tfp pilus assembly protein PilF
VFFAERSLAHAGRHALPRRTPAEVAMALMEPTRYGKYLLLEKIATGGMAVLYRAKIVGVQGFEKVIAIKQILPHLTVEKELVDAFIDEAKLAALLSHQNIVQIYDFGKIEDSYFISMEYLLGADLRLVAATSREREMPLRPEQALYIATRVCAGLEYAHNLRDYQGKALNIIHRDISPQNVIITYEGEVKIVDFGIAKAASQSTITQMGMIKGKVAYMSPEQASGNPIDHRSDIFSAGILLYEMLSGRKMFQGDTMQILAKVRRAEFEPPEAVAPGLPLKVYRILHRTLEKEPSDRYQTCGEMLADLEQCALEAGFHLSSRGLADHMKRLFAREIAAVPGIRREAPDAAAEADRRPPPEVQPVTASARGEAAPHEAAAADAEPAVAPAEKRGTRTPLLAGTAIAVALVLGVGGYLLMSRPSPSSQQELEKAPLPGAKPVPPPAPAKAPGAPASSDAARVLVERAEQVARTDAKEAISLLVQAVAADPKSARAHFELGLLYARQLEFPKAIEAYGKAADLEPRSADTLFNLAYVYAVTKQYPKAEQMYARTVTLEPSYLDEALYNLAVVQDRQGKKRQAIESLERVMRVNPRNTMAEKLLDRLKRAK